jgi:hypothetical protein
MSSASVVFASSRLTRVVFFIRSFGARLAELLVLRRQYRESSGRRHWSEPKDIVELARVCVRGLEASISHLLVDQACTKAD